MYRDQWREVECFEVMTKIKIRQVRAVVKVEVSLPRNHAWIYPSSYTILPVGGSCSARMQQNNRLTSVCLR